MPPIAIAEITSRPSATPGHTRFRIQAFEKMTIATATTIEMYARISLAGSKALLSVDPPP